MVWRISGRPLLSECGGGPHGTTYMPATIIPGLTVITAAQIA